MEHASRFQQQFDVASEGVGNLRGEQHVDSDRISKIPRFVTNDAAFWFMQVESVFNNGRISVERTKADHIIAGLDPDVLICSPLRIFEN